ncbi:MAG: cell surface protein SprA, partial [Tannerella sp.]|nr:cell surface protein SprA [Tannerella sp.]
GEHLRKTIGNDAIADKYVYQELYDSTMTYAKQIAEKNKFLMKGKYSGSQSNVIRIGSMGNVARGSVVVRANGVILTENVDYIVNYDGGIITILNDALISSNAKIDVSSENQSMNSMQRKTVLGADISYQLSKNFNIGGTVMHLSEMPMMTKPSFGDESVKNTMLGLNFDYKTESQWLTNMFDKLPLLQLSQPSSLSVNAEFAKLIAGHYQNKYVGEYSYLDDFESTQNEIDLQNPYFWNLSSAPTDNLNGSPLFPEATLTNNIDYGKNRALLSWYYIDGLFTRRNSSLRPSYMTNDDLSNHYVRAVLSEELFPNRDLLYSDNNYLNVLNLAYYPTERGPYNLDADKINPDGSLQNPEQRWGGMMRSLDQTDFELANVQYIEFWIMDPFIYEPDSKGGHLYFNLGEISEDILRDEKKFFENGLPVNGDLSAVDTTVWGKVPKQQSTVYAFDNTAGARPLQDVGFNGLSSAEEHTFPAYLQYVDRLKSKLNQETLTMMQADKYSPLNDPAGDDFGYFRSYDYDEQQADILTRYKHYNGVEGNSKEASETRETYGTSSKMTPDVEDFNMDNTLNENEKYFSYRVSIRPKDMVVGSNYIVDKRTTSVRLANGTREEVSWYQFKIPISEYTGKTGTIADFSSIRFMRMYMTDFEQTTILRFGKFALVRGEWRPYKQTLNKPGALPSTDATLAIATVNIEENGNREPVNYVLPPGVTRITDPSQPQLRQQNEQSLSLKVTNLAAQDAKAIYKTTYFDLRRFKRLQMFVHAEALTDDITDLSNGDVSVFIRLGSDYKNNYYEYEVPLTLTPHGSRDRNEVWPADNMMNINLETLTNLKLSRNSAKSNAESGVTYNSVYSEYDPDNTHNTVSVVGNPTLSEVKVIMVGIRNNAKDIKSAEIWINELRTTGFDESGGWAANANMNLNLSDFAVINATGNIVTAGFGTIEQSVSERSIEDHSQYSITTTVQLGKLFPEKVKISLPLYYAFTKETFSPLYNPIDRDILLQRSIDNETTRAGKDSIRNFSNDTYTTKAMALNNIRLDIRSKTPMPYDPANFTMAYSSNSETRKNPETEYETTSNFRANLDYSYNPFVKPIVPFKSLKGKSFITKYLNSLAIGYLPSGLTFRNDFNHDYYEIKLRDLNDLGAQNDFPVSFSQNFLWNRDFEIRWNPLSNVTMMFTSGTNARIEEGYLQVNRELNPDDYERWKDTVMKSIADMGTPLLYNQSMTVNYTPSFSQIPFLDWITGSAVYTATYNWEKGAFIDEFTNLGNSIKNQRQIQFQGALNLMTLYNKNEFIKRTLQKATAKRNSLINSQNSRDKKSPPPPKPPKPKTLEMTITLNRDSNTIVQHNMLTKKVSIRARRADDSTKRYKVDYKALDYARIAITNRDSVSLILKITPVTIQEESFAYKLKEFSVKASTMLRRISFNYTVSDGMYVPGFMPNIGNWFGQGSTAGGRAPGWDFAFGAVNKDFIYDYSDNGWLVRNSDNITPALVNHMQNITFRADLEPLNGLKINFDARHSDSRDTEIQFMSSGMPETRTGNFSMTTIGLGGFFAGSGDARKGYKSDVFEKMLNYRNVIASRMNKLYAGSRYPNSGFLEGTIYPNLESGYDPSHGSPGINSSDIIIPAFLAAYTNRKPEKVELTAFPSIFNIRPNWDASYDGLLQIPLINRYFKSIRLNHKYSCVYSIGGYSSYLNYVNAGLGGDLGYIGNTETGAPIPSLGYEIATISFVEGFNPLLGVDATLLNDITAGIKMSKGRNINLNVSSYQMVEVYKNDYTVSLGYKYAEFNKVLKLRKKGDFSNDLTVRCDYTYSKGLTLMRKFEEDYTQATQGAISTKLQFSADYTASRRVTLRAFYDLQINEPLVSSTAYPTSNSNYGISIQISLDNQ